MNSADPPPSIHQRPELFFALVGGAGTRLPDLSEMLRSELKTFGYETVDIRLSGLLPHFTGWVDQTRTGEDERIKHLQNMGNAFRKRLDRGDALALAGIKEIQVERAKHSKSPDDPAPAHAYIVHQLKHPAEVDLLRRVYGSSFLLIASHAPREKRLEALAKRMALIASKPDQWIPFMGKASEIITIDEKEDDDFGQNVRDTYPKADFFANLGVPLGEHEVRRFVDLLFGHPFHTPKPDEYAMYLASAVSLRSSDDNRQVGAVIVSLTRGQTWETIKNADIIAVGMNEVPRGEGGFYWDQQSPDARDQYLMFFYGQDRATEIKISALTELIERMLDEKWLNETIPAKSAIDLARELLPKLKGTQFLNIGEFSRPVHAEMAALIDAARRGVAVDGHSMYVTTFPCHNCAKHIIAAGIRRVVYLEPYPKSRADYLHGEEITLEALPEHDGKGKVAFFAFSGVAPRQYRPLFSMSERGAKKGKSLKRWNAEQGSLAPLYVPQNASLLYLAAERQALENLPLDIYNPDKSSVAAPDVPE